MKRLSDRILVSFLLFLYIFKNASANFGCKEVFIEQNSILKKNQDFRLVGQEESVLEKSIKTLSHTNGNKVVRVLRVRQIGGTEVELLPSNEEYLELFSKVSQFYKVNSGFKLSLTFEIHEDFLTEETYSFENCDSAECDVSVPYFAGLTSNTDIHFLTVLEDSCNCLKFRGLGQVLQQMSWVNGTPDFKVVAHELGHNFGASHANFQQQEYANYFSIMGTGEQTFDSHFSVAGKAQFKWLSLGKDSQVVSVARSKGCGDSLFADARESCFDDCLEDMPCEFELNAHDSGFYSQKLYGIRVATGIANVSVWLEYRSAFVDTKEGLLAVWSYESFYSQVTVSRYGPSQLLQSRVSTEGDETPKNAVIEKGAVWVYDLDNVGLVVKVKDVLVSEKAIQIQMYFTEHLAKEYNYSEQSQLFQTFDPTLFTGEQSNQLRCGTVRTLKVTEETSGALFALHLRNPTFLEMFYQTRCSTHSDSLSERAGIYVYPTYPLQHELNEEFDPTRGATHFFPLDCTPNSAIKEVFKSFLGETFLKGNVLITNNVSPNRNLGSFPEYETFSKENYILVYAGINKNVVSITVFVQETEMCQSFCEEVEVVGDVEVAGVYRYINDQQLYLRLDALFAITKVGDLGGWEVLSMTSEGSVVVSLSKHSHLHFVTEWSVQMEVICVGRPEFKRVEERAVDQRVFLTVLFMIICVVLTVVVFLMIKISQHRTELQQKKLYQKKRTLERPRKKPKPFVLAKNFLSVLTKAITYKDDLRGSTLHKLPRSSSLKAQLLKHEKSGVYKVYCLEFDCLKNSFELTLSNFGGKCVEASSLLVRSREKVVLLAICFTSDNDVLDRREVSHLMSGSEGCFMNEKKLCRLVGGLLRLTRNIPNVQMVVPKWKERWRALKLKEVKYFASTKTEYKVLPEQEFLKLSEILCLCLIPLGKKKTSAMLSQLNLISSKQAFATKAKRFGYSVILS